MDHAGAVLFFGFAVLLLIGGAGVYLAHTTGALEERWGRFKVYWAARNERVAEPELFTSTSRLC